MTKGFKVPWQSRPSECLVCTGKIMGSEHSRDGTMARCLLLVLRWTQQDQTAFPTSMLGINYLNKFTKSSWSHLNTWHKRLFPQNSFSYLNVGRGILPLNVCRNKVPICCVQNSKTINGNTGTTIVVPQKSMIPTLQPMTWWIQRWGWLWMSVLICTMQPTTISMMHYSLGGRQHWWLTNTHSRSTLLCGWSNARRLMICGHSRLPWLVQAQQRHNQPEYNSNWLIQWWKNLCN